ncbi:MAG: type II secretion system major pseudopilin GspG [Lentisphaeria bacterium]
MLQSRPFTLMEMLVVLAILALLAAIATPAYFTYLENSKVKAAKTQVKMLEQAALAYQLDVGRLPKSLEELVRNVDGSRKWNGPYLSQNLLPKDPWDGDFTLIVPGTHGRFDILSYGSDGQPGGSGTAADIGNWAEAEK